MGNGRMVRIIQFRKALPVLQTAIAVSFGGWGLWLRNSILSQPFFDSDGWHSTAVFHVWPWPLKFAMILNLPALLIGALLSWPLQYFRPALQGWVSDIPMLLLIPLFWYWIGSWTDKRVGHRDTKHNEQWRWILLFFFIFVCAAVSLLSGYVGGYTSFALFGIAIWLAVALVGIASKAR